jgi:galactokinase
VSAARAPRAREVATASVPGRICLAGESLDWMTGGNSVTAAVPLRTRVTAWRASGSDALALISGPPLYQTRLVPAARAAASVYDGDVLDHMQAAAKVTLPAADLAGVVVTASTDLPVGAGVSSSASLTLAVVAALAALQHGAAPGTADACDLARQAETGELGTGAGWMDFLACASGGVNQISAGSQPHAALITASLPLPVVLIDTRQRRATATVLASKRERFQAREPAMLAYVAETAALVQALTALLRSPQPDYREAGRLLSAAHALLRDQVACSTPLIEECVSRVLAAGAYGAKLSGSGHGGCLFALVPDDSVAAVLASVAGLPVHAVALPRSDPAGLACTPPAARQEEARPA